MCQKFLITRVSLCCRLFYINTCDAFYINVRKVHENITVIYTFLGEQARTCECGEKTTSPKVPEWRVQLSRTSRIRDSLLRKMRLPPLPGALPSGNKRADCSEFRAFGWRSPGPRLSTRARGPRRAVVNRANARSHVWTSPVSKCGRHPRRRPRPPRTASFRIPVRNLAGTNALYKHGR